MPVSVVIGNYEGEQVLPACLASLQEQSLLPDEVIVVDAGSRDASRATAEAAGARVVDAPNRGLGFLYNRGVEAASGDHVLLANNDVAFDTRCLERLAAALDADGSRFAADPKQIEWAGDRVIHARTTLRRGSLLREYIPGLHLDPVVPATAVVPTVSAHGAAMLVRRSMFEELGGFDETFFMEWEDLDLCWRAWLRGWSSAYVPDAWLEHRVGAVTTARILPRRLASSHHNLMRFALKCLPAGAAARVLLGEALRLPRHPRIVAPALVRVVRELPQIARLRRETEPRSELFDWMLAGQPA
jgi:N-acetylglucosaminyl-diphospho-decaprenol L-rhamnosyltransferase